MKIPRKFRYRGLQIRSLFTIVRLGAYSDQMPAVLQCLTQKIGHLDVFEVFYRVNQGFLYKKLTFEDRKKQGTIASDHLDSADTVHLIASPK